MRPSNKHSNQAKLADLDQIRVFLSRGEGALLLSYLQHRKELTLRRLSRTDLYQSPHLASRDQGLIAFIEEIETTDDIMTKLKEHQKQLCQPTQ